MKHPLSAVLVLSLALVAPTFAAGKKSKKPTGTPSTLPPTSPMLVVPQPDGSSPDPNAGKIISSEMSGRDLEFFTKAVNAGREQAFYVDLLKKSASSEIIKKLADALTATQNEENMHLAKLAGQKGWTVSLQPTAQEKKAGEEIARLSGSNFDKAAMDKVVTASNVALTAYQNAAQSNDAQIKSFAAQMIPLAQEKRHLVEKMTGAGAKAANQLFRHGGTSQTTLAEAPAAEAPTSQASTPEAPESKPSPEPKEAAEPKATPAAAIKATSGGGSVPSSKSPPVEKATPAGKPAATPALSSPASLSLPVATPPGMSTPAPQLPPIVPSKAPLPPAK